MRTYGFRDVQELLKKVQAKYHIDLSNYASASIDRRISHFLSLHPLSSPAQLAEKICGDRSFFEFFIREITVNTTEMFRDPEVWKEIRKSVLPQLRDVPSIRIWHAGCSSGEEIYTLAIILFEEGLLEKSKIVATDINREVMERAKLGEYALKSLETNLSNYILSGGKRHFTDYYRVNDTAYTMDKELLQSVRFTRHDLSSDNSFSKFDIILCRNVLIYFNKTLQERAFSLFAGSLFKKGFVITGKKETMSWYSGFSDFSEFNEVERIYRLK